MDLIEKATILHYHVTVAILSPEKA